MKLNTLQDLFIDELRDLYNAETQLLKALPKMAKGASSAELKQALEEHLAQTKGHVERLEQIFDGLGENPKGKTCHAMKGLVEEGKEMDEVRGLETGEIDQFAVEHGAALEPDEATETNEES